MPCARAGKATRVIAKTRTTALTKPGTVRFQCFPEELDPQGARNNTFLEREMRRRSGGLAHHEAGPGDPGRRLPAMGHRSTAPGHQQIVDAQRYDHAVRKLVDSLFVPLKYKFHIARDMTLARPAVDADRAGKARAVEHVVLGQHVFAAHPARLADADLRRDVGDIVA